MFYSSFGLLALILHLIINNEMLFKSDRNNNSKAYIRYRYFLISLIIYYIADILWGVFFAGSSVMLTYADTVIYFLSMATSVLLWTRYVVAYHDRKNVFVIILNCAGWTIYSYMVLTIVVNFFKPVLFKYNANGEYLPGHGRYMILGMQAVMYIISSVYTLVIATGDDDRIRIRNKAVGLSGIVMTIFIIFQNFYPLLPFYAIGCIIGTSFIHVFVEENEKIEYYSNLLEAQKEAERERAISEKAKKEKEVYNQIANSLAEDYEIIYYVDVQSGRYTEFLASNMYDFMKVSRTLEDFYKDAKESSSRCAHPDDRAFAVNMYDRETILKYLAGRKSYSYRYRIMVNGKARYFSFTVISADSRKHFVLCGKDIDEELTAEADFLANEKKHVTFGQIAESLAVNYDAIYYVDVEDGSYTGYTTKNIYGELEVKNEGDDFFTDARNNVRLIVHPEDLERVVRAIDKDYLLTALQIRKQFSIDYRLVINGAPNYTRLIVRMTSDEEHFIIGVENIDDEVRKEKEHMRALDSEKELARRDELTGTKNKTAYAEFERLIQEEIDNKADDLSFAIVVCDLNDLKKINDQYGHQAGDEYIKYSAEILCDIFVHSPVFRVGGDEFVVFLRYKDYNSREMLINTAYRKINENLSDKKGPVIAVGISEYEPGSDSTVADVFERADRKMYENKRQLKSIV